MNLKRSLLNRRFVCLRMRIRALTALFVLTAALGLSACSGTSNSGVNVYEGMYEASLVGTTANPPDLYTGAMEIKSSGLASLSIAIPGGPAGGLSFVGSVDVLGAITLAAGDFVLKGNLTESQGKYVVINGQVLTSGNPSADLFWNATRL